MDHPKLLLVFNGWLDPAAPGDAARIERDHSLHTTNTWRIFQPLLAAQRDAIQVERAQLTGHPLTLALAAAGAKHDAFGRAFWHATALVLEDPEAADEDRAAAEAVRGAFLPALAQLKLSNAAEIANARLRAPKIAAYAAQLDRIPAAGGRTARHLVQGMIDAGEERARLITERAATPAGTPVPAFALQAGIALIFDLRATLAREIEANAALPRDLDRQVFALFDQQRG